MRNKFHLIILFSAYFVIQVCLNIVIAAEIPEVFVQTGHTRGVDYLAVDENEKYLVTAESVGVQKIWEIATGKEVRTLKVKGIVSNLYFNGAETFVLHSSEKASITKKNNEYLYVAEIYNIYGEKLEKFNLPKISSHGKAFITKNKKYLYVNGGSGKVQYYDIKDGTEIKLPEQSDNPYDSGMISLGFGYFGYFYNSSRDNKENIGNTSYVIYDESLRVRKRGLIKGICYIGDNHKVDPDLRYFYENKSYIDDPVIVKYDLDSGTTISSVRSKRGNVLSLLPDGRIILDSGQSKGKLMGDITFDRKLSIIEFLGNGIYKEKNILLEQINSPYSIVYTNQAKVIAAHRNSDVKMYDLVSGRELLKFGVKPVLFNESYLSAEKLLNIEEHFSFTSKKAHVNFNLWNMATASLEKFNIQNTTSDVFDKKYENGWSGNWTLSNPADFYSQIPKEFFNKDYDNEFYRRAMSTLGNFLHNSNFKVNTPYQVKRDCILLYNPVLKSDIAKLYSFSDGEWIVITPEGYFNASPGGAKHLNVRVGNNVHGIDQFYSKFYRPEFVQIALSGKELPKGELLTDIASKKPAPSIQILSPATKSTVDQDSVALTLKVTDNGGGIGDVNVYLNGAQVANETRSVMIKGKASAHERILSFTIPLIAGQNEIRAVAFNGENSMESNPALVNVISRAVMQKPNLYALVIGINEYKNKSISLNYAVPDAKAFAETLKKTAAPLFEKITVQVLTMLAETTREAITKAFEALRPQIKPNDLFIFYNASHGLVDVVDGEEQYFLLTSNVLLLSSRHIGKDAMSQKELAKLIGNIPAQKKVVILDTCNAGKGGREIQVALLQQTRGLTDSTAVKLLQRAIGSAVFSASSDTQLALEGYKGHGLFTYVLLEGLKGKADIKKDGYITVLGLADYVEENVIKLSEEVFKRQQTPTIQTGANFPLGKVK